MLFNFFFYFIYKDLPGPPSKPNILETDDTSVNIHWCEPASKGYSEITCYILEYQEINTTQYVHFVLHSFCTFLLY